MPRYLGQHFLVDTQILERIVAAISTLSERSWATTMREIWPGQWALTQHIYKLSTQFRCFEKDETMKKYLWQFLQPEQIVRWDILQSDVYFGWEDARDALVVGNLPYYITSPILRKFFTEGMTPWWGVFLIQKEVAEKIKTTATKKSYLRWLLNNRYRVDYLFTVPPKSFDPPPKVESAVVVLERRNMPILSDDSYDRMLVFLDTVAGMKRKTLGKIQKILAKNHTIIHVPEMYVGKRIEELDREDIAVFIR